MKETPQFADNTVDPVEDHATSALLVNPTTRTVRAVTINGYDGIKDLLGKKSELEGNTLCRVRGDVYLQVWADCTQYMVGPAFVSSLGPRAPLHGLTVIAAYDIKTGEAVDCPVSPEDLLETIEWEEADNRINPDRPNADWIARFQISHSAADYVIQYGTTNT